MWLKIITGIYSAAKAAGLDKKIVEWVKRRLNKQRTKLFEKIVVLEQTVAANPELDSEDGASE